MTTTIVYCHDCGEAFYHRHGVFMRAQVENDIVREELGILLDDAPDIESDEKHFTISFIGECKQCQLHNWLNDPRNASHYQIINNLN